jgi:hypothetical protein
LQNALPQRSLEASLAALKGDSHFTIRHARLPETQLSGPPCCSTTHGQNEKNGGPEDVTALNESMKAKDESSLYEQFNELLKDLHFERLRRSKVGTPET